MHDLKLVVKEDKQRTELYNKLLEAWDKKSAQEKAKIVEETKKVLGEYYDEAVRNYNDARAEDSAESD